MHGSFPFNSHYELLKHVAKHAKFFLTTFTDAVTGFIHIVCMHACVDIYLFFLSNKTLEGHLVGHLKSLETWYKFSHHDTLEVCFGCCVNSIS